jgi:hypothetical protein
VALGAPWIWYSIAARSAARVVSAEAGGFSVLIALGPSSSGVGAASLFRVLAPARAGRVPLSRARPFRTTVAPGRVPGVNTAVKWVGAAIAVPVIAIALYLGAVVQLYILAYVIQIIGNIFG